MTDDLIHQVTCRTDSMVMKGAHAIMRGIEAPGFTVSFQNEGTEKCAINFYNLRFEHGNPVPIIYTLSRVSQGRQSFCRPFYSIAVTYCAAVVVLHRFMQHICLMAWII